MTAQAVVVVPIAESSTPTNLDSSSVSNQLSIVSQTSHTVSINALDLARRLTSLDARDDLSQKVYRYAARQVGNLSEDAIVKIKDVLSWEQAGGSYPLPRPPIVLPGAPTRPITPARPVRPIIRPPGRPPVPIQSPGSPPTPQIAPVPPLLIVIAIILSGELSPTGGQNGSQFVFDITDTFYKHLLYGEWKNGKLQGVHSVGNNSRQLTNGVINISKGGKVIAQITPIGVNNKPINNKNDVIKTDRNGIWKGMVVGENPISGLNDDKATGSPSTFFPRNWSEEDLVNALNEAWKNPFEDADHVSGIDPNSGNLISWGCFGNILIQFVRDPKSEEMKTAFPIFGNYSC